MSMVRGGFGGGLTRGADERTQRERNAEAPHIPHLGRRIVALFSPYRGRLAVTAVLVVLSAALGVVPAWGRWPGCQCRWRVFGRV